MKVGRPTIALMGYPGCSVFPETNNSGVDSDGKPWICDKFNGDVFAYAQKPGVKAVVITAYWEVFITTHNAGSEKGAAILGTPQGERVLTMFEKQVADVVKSGKAVYIILSNPVEQPTLRGETPRRLVGFPFRATLPFATRKYEAERTRLTTQLLRQIAANTGATIIDPDQYLCDTKVCPATTPRGEPIYRDDNHLHAGYVRRNAVWIDPVFKRL
jgi:hypothetical protein